MSEDARFEMLWDCKFCGQKKLLGLTQRFCASCGAPQDPGTRYFPSDDEKVAVGDHPFVGADVGCPACGTFMSRAAKCCTNCGGPLGSGKDASVRADEVKAEGQSFARGQKGAPAANLYHGGPAPLAPPPAPEKSRMGLYLALFGAALALVVVGMLSLKLWKKDGTFEVVGHRWERTIDVEVYGATRKEAWCDELPGGAKVVARKRAERSKEKVKDGEDCQMRRKDLGDGTFKQVKECTPRFKDKPVLDDRCTYEVMTWRAARTLDARGAAISPAPAWPAAEGLRGGSCEGCERAGARRQKYELLLSDGKGEPKVCVLPEDRWRTFEKGRKVEAKVGVALGGIDCDSLR